MTSPYNIDIRTHRLNSSCVPGCPETHSHTKTMELVALYPGLYWEDVNYSLVWRKPSRDEGLSGKSGLLDHNINLYSHSESKSKLLDTKSPANWKMMQRFLSVNLYLEPKRMRTFYIPPEIQSDEAKENMREWIWASTPMVSSLEIPVLSIQALWFLTSRNVANQNKDLTKRQVANIAKLISNPNCPSELLKFYCFDANDTIRNAAMGNPSCLEEHAVEAALYQIRRDPLSGLPEINPDPSESRNSNPPFGNFR